MSLWSKIRGTIETIWQIGLGGPQVKNNAGNVDMRNAGDTAYVIVRGATPVAANDLATKAYVDNGSVIADGGVQTIRVALGTGAAQNSTTQIPASAIIVGEFLDIQTPYSAGTTITVGNAGSPALVMAAGDSLATAAGIYQGNVIDTSWGGSPATVLFTIAGSPSVGAGFGVVQYVQSPQP